MQSRMNGVAIMTSTAGTRPMPSARGMQALRDRRLQHARELDADLPLLMRRKDRDDAVDRLRRVERVQRREHEVAGFGGDAAPFRSVSKSRISPTRMTSGSCRSALRSACANERRVDRDLALVDDRLVVPMEVLDRILDRHDVRRARRVDVVDHRGERRALAAAGRAGDEDQPALLLGDLLEDGRQAEVVDRPDAERDDAQDDADRAALLEDVAAEAAEAGHAVGEVDLLGLAELLDVLGAHDRARHRLGVVAVEPLLLGRDDQRRR